jgi:hypothetical protein
MRVIAAWLSMAVFILHRGNVLPEQGMLLLVLISHHVLGEVDVVPQHTAAYS